MTEVSCPVEFPVTLALVGVVEPVLKIALVRSSGSKILGVVGLLKSIVPFP